MENRFYYMLFPHMFFVCVYRVAKYSKVSNPLFFNSPSKVYMLEEFIIDFTNVDNSFFTIYATMRMLCVCIMCSSIIFIFYVSLFSDAGVLKIDIFRHPSFKCLRALVADRTWNIYEQSEQFLIRPTCFIKKKILYIF